MTNTTATRQSRPAATTRPTISVIVPAYNEAEHVAETVRSLRAQTVVPDEIIVIDDCSTDGTADAARRAGAKVVTPPENTGSKAGAQNFALAEIETELTMAVDADTVLEPHAVEYALAEMEDPQVAATCGFVIPRRVRSLWERGRYIEYLLAFTFFKRVQDYFAKPLISSGCFSLYRTDVLRRVGGWSTRTLAEDMDLTWTLYRLGWKVRFAPQAVCYPVEPATFGFLSKQLRRWSHGFVQNVRLHWSDVKHIGYLRSAIAVACWDALVASLLFLIGIPLLAIFVSPFFLLGYVVDAPVLLVPIFIGAAQRGEFIKAVASLPAFFVLRTVNAVFMVQALWQVVVRNRPQLVYEKGH
jgi:cellulose synthase/poly-beta-1,6-N-acetylglucosamine synthase-like glycosyltransferase